MRNVDFINSVTVKHNFSSPTIEATSNFLFRNELLDPCNELSIRNALVIIYLLAQSQIKGQHLKKCYNDVTSLRDESGSLFLDDLEYMFQVVSELKKLQSILISIKSGSASLEFSDNSINSYRKRFGGEMKPVESFTVIRKAMILTLHTYLMQDEPIHANFEKENI